MMLTIEDLKSKDCRWPAETQNGETLFCGEPVLNDCPYCALHAAIAYNKRKMVQKATKAPPHLRIPSI
jgi:hypothetical protein